MTPPTDAEIREAFEAWWREHPPLPHSTDYTSTRQAYLAAARKYGAEVERLRSECRHAHEHVLARSEQVDELQQREDEANCALPPGYRVDSEHSLADRVREIVAERDKWKHTACESERMRLVPGCVSTGVTPDPLAAAKDRVVEAAMAYWSRCGATLRIPAEKMSDVDWEREDKERDAAWDPLDAACAALRALQQPSDPVREARDILNVYGARGLPADKAFRCLSLLDSALADR